MSVNPFAYLTGCFFVLASLREKPTKGGVFDG